MARRSKSLYLKLMKAELQCGRLEQGQTSQPRKRNLNQGEDISTEEKTSQPRGWHISQDILTKASQSRRTHLNQTSQSRHQKTRGSTFLVKLSGAFAATLCTICSMCTLERPTRRATTFRRCAGSFCIHHFDRMPDLLCLTYTLLFHLAFVLQTSLSASLCTCLRSQVFIARPVAWPLAASSSALVGAPAWPFACT
jgi:hypothetical protein